LAGTSIPSPVFTPTGLSIPSQAAVLAGAQADINQAFGANLDYVSDSAAPQVQLAASIAAIINNVYASFLSLVNQFDPQYAFGRYQDGLCEVYDLIRDPAESTVVQATCSGLTNTIIPVGALAQDTSGNIYTCQEAGTIRAAGSVVLPFAAIVPGPIPCPEGALSSIYQAIPGWDSVTNASDGVIGQLSETRSQLEARREATLAANANNILQAVRGAVLNVVGVLDCYTAENQSSAPITVGGVTLVPNSMYVAVVGGLAAAVAAAIYSKKAPGCNMNGNTVVAVQDTAPPYVSPFPSYNITFEIPSSLPILVSVTLANNPNVPANAAQLVQAAVVAVFAGNGGQRPLIGSTVYASNFYAAIAALGSWVTIIEIMLGSPNSPGAQFTASSAGATLTVSAVGAGTIAVGQILTDTTGAIAPGTTIAAFGSGSGGTGTYTISQSQTVGSEAMSATTPSLNSVTANANQVPTINAADVVLALV
jgi:hypothetical protein